jgi:hypothetical protein
MEPQEWATSDAGLPVHSRISSSTATTCSTAPAARPSGGWRSAGSRMAAQRPLWPKPAKSNAQASKPRAFQSSSHEPPPKSKPTDSADGKVAPWM